MPSNGVTDNGGSACSSSVSKHAVVRLGKHSGFMKMMIIWRLQLQALRLVLRWQHVVKCSCHDELDAVHLVLLWNWKCYSVALDDNSVCNR